MKKISIYMIILTFIFHVTYIPVSAEANDQIEDSTETMVTVTVESQSDQVFLYEEESETSEQVAEVEDGDEVAVLEIFEDVSYVEYDDTTTNIIYQGYLSNEYLTLNDLNEEDKEEATEDSSEEQQEDSNQKDAEDHSEVDLEDDGHKNEEESTLEQNQENSNDENEDIDEEKNDEEQKTTKSNQSNSHQSLKLAADSPSIHGNALKSPTYVYESQSRNSKKLKSYEIGSVLKYRVLNVNWYEATVKYNGKWVTGYIHVNDVGILPEDQVTLNGTGNKNPTYVYELQSKDSKKLKSYERGTVLKYKTLNDDWYEAKIKYNGEWVTGYIQVSDVDDIPKEQQTLQGLADQSPTYIYEAQSKVSKQLKSYKKGSVLKFKTLNDKWYEATIKYSGKWVTGYIHVNDVTTFPETQKTLIGIASKSPTNVYQTPTKDKTLKSYKQGSILKYKTLTADWYEATVKYNGEYVTGYIHVNDVEETFDEQEDLTGAASKKTTKVYSKASRNSSVLKSYKKGSRLIFKTFSPNWFEAKVYIKGKPKTGYIHVSDITFEDIKTNTNYNLTLNQALEIQKKASAQTDKNYTTYVSKSYIDKNNKVKADTLNVRGGPSTNYWVVGQLKKGEKVTILKETGNWYQIEFTKTRQWVNASPEDILYYLDPNNFINDSKQKFQFLDLSKPSGAPASVLNNYLSGKGILSGQGQAFIDSGVQNGINDVYLISHALLETGNGTSQLARGVKYNGVTVYNMFGVNAFDSCPVECGAKKAYEEGWTTPYKAIVGGAKFIDSYIYNGQNTLYKMRWNPEAMEKTGQYGKQYATDIGWASKQVNTMYNLYQQLDSYILNLDVPVYKK